MPEPLKPIDPNNLLVHHIEMLRLRIGNLEMAAAVNAESTKKLFQFVITIMGDKMPEGHAEKLIAVADAQIAGTRLTVETHQLDH